MDFNKRVFITSVVLKIPKEKIIVEGIRFPSKVYEIEKRVEDGEPLEYLVKRCWFMGLELFIDRGVFIPRPETEELVEKIFKMLKNPFLIFEVGTGTGCISIALARNFKNANIFATEIDERSYKTALKNIKKFGLQKRIKIYKASLFSIPGIRNLKNKFDLVVSNPPYIPEDELSKLSNSVRNYESKTALDGGKDGVKVIKEIIKGAKHLLKEKGLLAMEITERNLEGIKRSLKKENYKEFEIQRDLSGNIRFLFAQR